MGVGGRMRSRIVFCEEAGSVVGGEDEDGVDGEEGEVGGHGSEGERKGDRGISRTETFCCEKLH